MKPLILAAFAVLSFAVPPASAQSSHPRSEPGRQPSWPAPGARSPKGPEGYAPEALAKNLEVTGKNIDSVLAVLETHDKEGDSPEPWTNEAQQQVVVESAAAEALIVDGNAALAAGIPRKTEQDDALSGLPVAGYASRAVLLRKFPTLRLAQRDYAAAQVNVAMHLASLIRLKRQKTPNPGEEADVAAWLASAQKTADLLGQRLVKLREMDARARVRKNAEKAGLRSSSTFDD